MEEHFSAVIAAAGIDPATARCRIERDGSSLEVHIDLPEAVSQGVEHALAVRVLDAVHSSGRTFGDINVYVHSGKLTQ